VNEQPWPFERKSATAQADPYPDWTLDTGSSRYSTQYWRGKSTKEIVDSLKPGAAEPLITKPDGRIMDGNARIRVLEERGFDINSLPRTILE
jgi:hypothetical protein